MTPASTHPDQDVLMDLAYGELSQTEALEVQRHVDGCADCTGTLASIGGVRRAMAPLADVEAPDAGLDSLLAYAAQAAARNAAAPVAKRRWWQRIGMGGLAAAISALCLLLLVSLPELGLMAPPLASRSAEATVSDWNREDRLAQLAEGGARERDDLPSRNEARGSTPQAEPTAPVVAMMAPPPPPPPPAVASAPRKRMSRAARETLGIESKGGGASSSAMGGEGSASQLAEAEVAEEARSEPESPRSKAVAAAPKPSVTPAPASSGAGAGSLGGTTGGSRSAGVLGGAPATPPAEPAAQPARRAKADEGRAAADAVAAPGAVTGLDPGVLLEEATSLRAALARGATGRSRSELLSRLCRVEDALGEASRADATCGSLLREFPAAPGSDFARQRQQARPVGGGAADGG